MYAAPLVKEFESVILCVLKVISIFFIEEHCVISHTCICSFLLPMHINRNDYDDTIPILDALKVTANIVFGYAT